MHENISRPNYFFRSFKDFFNTLEQNQSQNLWVHIWKEHKILRISDCFLPALVDFKWPENEWTFFLKTFAAGVIFNQIIYFRTIFLLSCFFDTISVKIAYKSISKLRSIFIEDKFDKNRCHAYMMKVQPKKII
jgi:hypothetical protein